MPGRRSERKQTSSAVKDGRSKGAALVTVLALSAFAPAAHAAEVEALGPNRLRAVEHAAHMGGTVLVRLSFAQPLAAPPAFFRSYHPTPRIVLTFADTTAEVQRGPIEVSPRSLRSIEVVQSGANTRVVFNLAAPLRYEAELKGAELLVTLRPR